MGQKTYAAIIFDLDGTLIEDNNIKKHGDEILQMTLTNFNVKRTQSKDRIGFWFSGGGFLQLLEKWGIKSGLEKKSFLEALSQNEYDVKKRLIESGDVRLYEDSDILNRLQGVLKLGLVTNSSNKTVSLELDSFNLRRYFDSTVALGDFTNNLKPKPDPDGILQCLKEIDEDPSEAIVVGDNLTDIIAGNRSKTHTALLIRGKRNLKPSRQQSKHTGTDFKLRSLRQLESIIKLP
jgi:pyrophosphatase PpaX